jgi:hypothetical protein
MSAPRLIALAPGLLVVVLAASLAPSGTARGLADSPEAKLRAKIADLHAELALLEVECSATKANLLESLKKLGQLELGDKKAVIASIKNDVEELVSVLSERLGDKKELRGFMTKTNLSAPWEVVEKLQREIVKPRTKQGEDLSILFGALRKGGDHVVKALDRVAEEEYQSRRDAVRAQSDRMKADLLKKTRQLHVKKMELADADAEYKATR